MYPEKEKIVILRAFGSEAASAPFVVNRVYLSPHPASLTPTPRHSTLPQTPSMSKDYGRLLKKALKANDEGDAVRILLEILSDKEGRNFITNLKDKEDAKRCIEILDYVSRNLHPPRLPPSQIIFPGHRRGQAQIRRKASFLACVEEARWSSRTVA